MAKQNRCPHCGTRLPANAPRGVCPRCLMEAALPDIPNTGFHNPLAIEGPGTKIGHYELLELIGEGGMGLVYLAEQKEPVKRKVAFKIVKLGMDTKQVVARFETERQTLAVLEHPNIAHVFDAGTTEAGRPYFVMEYVEGKSITKYCDEQKLSVEERLELFQQVCEGVHHAHQKGIIHRDIKPSNILVSIHGEKAIPKIIDFGIAKAITQPLTEKTSFTKHDQLLGTPEYMSPEQAEMAYQDIDTRSDIYSLGVVLYELLTGAPPFDAKRLREGGIDHIQQVICEEEPRTPSARLTSLGDKAKAVAESRRTQIITLTRRLHRELEWIPMKAMRKERTRRYRSASELADDIQNYLTGTPLIAGPESTVYRARKFVRKHAGSVATAALLLVVIVLGLVASILMGCRAELAREQEAVARAQAQEQQGVAEERAEKYRRLLYTHSIALADVAYRNADINRMNELLGSCPEDLRGWEWNRLNHIRDQSCTTLHGHAGTITMVAVSPDGKRIASSGGTDKTIRVWDSRSGAELMTLYGHTDWVCSVSFRPDGKRIVSGGFDGTIKVWDAPTGGEVMTIKGHEGAAGAFFTPDGKRIVSGSQDKTIKVWNVETGAKIKTLGGHEEPLMCHAISPDGSRIASQSYDDTIRVWDATTGAELMVLRGHESAVGSVAFSPDSNRIVCSANKNVKVLNAETGSEVMTLRGHGATVYHVEWSPDGKYIVSTSEDRTIRTWDATTGVELRVLRGHEANVTYVTFNPANGQLVSCGWDETIKIWDLTVDREYMQIGDREWQRGGGFSPDGKRIVSGNDGGRITVWDRSTGTELMILRGPEGNAVFNTRFSPDGRRIFSSQSKKGTVWDATTGLELMSFHGEDRTIVDAAFSPDGRYFASWIINFGNVEFVDNTIRLRDAVTGKEIKTFGGHKKNVGNVVFSPDSRRLASCTNKGPIKVWDVETGKEIMTLKHSDLTGPIAFSPDGSRIAAGSNGGTIRLWDVKTGAEIISLKGHHLWILSLSFSPDGKRLISTGRDRMVKLWDISTGTEVMSWPQFRGSATFSPNGKTIAIAGEGGITLLESEVPADGYESRRTGAAARKVVDELYKEHGLYSEVIDKLKADKVLSKSLRKIALQIANARLWEDEE